jgi:hypothetical protein
VDAVEDGTHGVIVVHELAMEAPYTGMVTIHNGKTIALLAAQGEAPIIQGTGMGNPGVRVEGAGTVLYMDGLQVSQSAAQGLTVNDAFAWVDRSRIVDNNGGGILAQNGAELVLRNCFVGGSVNNVPAFLVDDATAEVLYSTVAAGFGTATALTCDATSNVLARNSLFVAETNTAELMCDAMLERNATEADLGGTNVSLGEMSTTWFVDYARGDFHLTATHPVAIATTAQWTTGDPLTDIDGDLRPTVDGMPDYAGADVPTP